MLIFIDGKPLKAGLLLRGSTVFEHFFSFPKTILDMAGGFYGFMWKDFMVSSILFGWKIV